MRVSFTWCRFANQIKCFRSLNGRVIYDHCFFDGRDLSSDPKLTKEFSKEYMNLGFGRRIPNIGNTTHIMNCYYLECGIQRGEDLKNLRGYRVRNQDGTGRVDNTYLQSQGTCTRSKVGYQARGYPEHTIREHHGNRLRRLNRRAKLG